MPLSNRTVKEYPGMIDLKKNEARLKRAIERARERRIIIPTFQEMKNPQTVPEQIKDKLKRIGLWDVNPLNLFRITWKNEPVSRGGLFGDTNFMELPKELTGVEARILALVGKWFPTGSHKVGATFGCLVPRLVTGQFDPTRQKAVWPSTGNFCRGGAYDATLLACESIAILPEEMSQERFDWLSRGDPDTRLREQRQRNLRQVLGTPENQRGYRGLQPV
jgi:cysteine synthase A